MVSAEALNQTQTRGIVIAAPASGSGKTTLTLALLRYLRTRGDAVASVKIGPDYIDPSFHRAASGQPCYNFDGWAMRSTTLTKVLQQAATAAQWLIAEGVMGLFDGAGDGSGTTAAVAESLDWPIILVIDAQGMAASAAAVVHGFNSLQPTTAIAGVIFNRIGGPGHERLLRAACQPLAIPVLGCIPRHASLTLPERHLGLVPAQEHEALEAFLQQAAEFIAQHLDVDALFALAKPADVDQAGNREACLPPLGQCIALANDVAFSFVYPHVLDSWQAAGAEILPFSPLADQVPAAEADAIYLPGGYPELHAGRLAANQHFRKSLQQAAQRGRFIYGECGGYMVLGESLVNSERIEHPMLGLLPLKTSFAERQLHLGYRQLTLLSDSPLGAKNTRLRGHEFHFSKVLHEGAEQRLFSSHDALGQDLGTTGMRLGSVMGSYMHLIDQA